MVAKKPLPQTGKAGQKGKAGTGGAAGGVGGKGGEGGTTGGAGGKGGEGGGGDSSQRLTVLVVLAVLAVGVISTMLLFVNNKIERSLGRSVTAIEEIRAIQEDTGGLKAALDLAERQRQAQARRIMQLIKALRDAGVEVPELPKNGSALSLSPGASQGGGNTGPGTAKSPSPAPPPTQQPQPSEPPPTHPSPSPPGPPDVVCFDPPSPIAGPICVGSPT